MTATKWQYNIRRGELSQDALNVLGNEGWELISVVADPDGPRFYFKRPLPSLAESITLEQRERYFDEWGVGSGQLT